MNFRIWQYSRNLHYMDGRNYYGFRLSELDSLLIYKDNHVGINKLVSILITK